MIRQVSTVTCFSAFTAGLFVLVSTASLFARDTKRPVPPDTEQQQALALAREIYGEEYKSAKTADQKRALAEKILQKASESKDDPTAQYVLLRLAKDIAVPAGEIDLAMRALDQIGAAYRIDCYQLKLETLSAAAQNASGTRHRASLAGHALQLMTEAVACDDFDNAKKLCGLAQAAARQSRDRDLTQRLSIASREIDQIATSFEVARPFISKLKEARADPNASTMAGRYQCFVKGNWAQGLSLLAQGSEEKIKSVAASELDGTVGKEADLADQWWEVAEALEGRERDVVLLHAADLYRKALPQLTALVKARVEKRLEEVKNIAVFTAEGSAGPVPLVSALPPGAVLVLTFEPNTFYREQNRLFVKDLSGKNNLGEVVGATVVDGKAGKAVSFDRKSFVAVSGNFPLGNTPRTICLWVRVGEDYDGTSLWIFAYGDPQKRSTLFDSYVSGPNWHTGGGLNCGDRGKGWHHQTTVYDGKELRAYLDGAKRKATVWPFGVDQGSYDTRHGPLVIGGKLKGKGVNFAFPGSVDEFAIFDRALTDEEVKQVYELGVNGQNLARQGR